MSGTPPSRGEGLMNLATAISELRRQNEGDTVGGDEGGGRRGGGMLAAIGGLTAGFLGLLGAAKRLGGQFMDMNRAVLNTNRHLQRYNGLIARTNAEAEIAQIQRNVDRAQRIGPEFAQLGRAQIRAEDALADIYTPLTEARLELQAWLTDNGIVPILEMMEPYAEYFAEMIKWLVPGDPDLEEANRSSMLGARALLSDAHDGKLDGKTTDWLQRLPSAAKADTAAPVGPMTTGEKVQLGANIAQGAASIFSHIPNRHVSKFFK